MSLRNFLSIREPLNGGKVFGVPKSAVRIFVVDDAKDELLLIQRILEHCKILNEILLFNSTIKCIAQIEALQAEHPHAPDPSLIFVDLVMPGGGGAKLLEYLQHSTYRTRCVPIMLSGLKDVKSINQGYQLGARTFLLKPLTFRDVVELVNSLGDRITIETTADGYVLHWTEVLRANGTDLGKTSRVVSLAS